MQKDFEAFIGQGEQTQGRSWRLAKETTSCGCEEEKRGRKENEWEEDFFLVLMCGEVLMGSVCVRIKHERNLCGKASGLLVQLVVSLKSTVRFVSNLNQC